MSDALVHGSPPAIVVLGYHAVVADPLAVPDACFLEAEAFRRQLRWLRQQLPVIPLSEAVSRIEAGRIDETAAVLTLDDGFQNVRDVALPILEEEGCPATVFVVTGLVDTERTLWFCCVHGALERTERSHLDWDGERFDLASAAARARASHRIQARLKRHPHPRLVEEASRLSRALGDDPERPLTRSSPYRMLDRRSLSELAASELVEIGAHTESHAILSGLAPAAQRREVEASLAAVRALTGARAPAFAYPNGSASDFGAEALDILRACGARAAVTTIEGANDAATPLLELRRIGPGRSVGELRERLARALPGFRGVH